MSPNPKLPQRFREKAERILVYPLNRDECVALVEAAEAAYELWHCDYAHLTGAQMDMLHRRLEDAFDALEAMPFEKQLREPLAAITELLRGGGQR